MISDFLHFFIKSFLSFIRTQFKIKVTQWTSSISDFIQMVKKAWFLTSSDNYGFDNYSVNGRSLSTAQPEKVNYFSPFLICTI